MQRLYNWEIDILKTTDAVTILRNKFRRRTMYSVNIMPVIPEEEVYDFVNTESVCYTRFKTWEWLVFLYHCWKLVPDKTIQLITLRPGK